eukprot:206726_1
MSMFSQLFNQIEYHSKVMYYIKTVQKNCLTHLNNNEIADKTAHTKNGYNQLITQKYTHKGHNNNITSFKTKNIPEEQNKCPIIITWNNKMYYSNQSVDPPPGQPISSNIIIIVGFAVDPPPDQLTPSHIIIIVSLVENIQPLSEKHYSSIVTNIDTNPKTINLIMLNNGYNTNLNIRFPYAAAVGLNLHTITKQGASSTLDVTHYQQRIIRF